MGKNGSCLLKILIGLLVFFVVALSLTYLFFTPLAKKAVTAKIGPLFENRLKFTEVGISVPARSIVITGITLQQPPDFGAGNFLTVKSVYLQVAFRPLLKKKVVVSNLIVTNPEIKLIQNSKGKTNLEYYFAMFAKKGASKESSAFRLHLDKISFRNGRASIVSPKLTTRKPALEVAGLNILLGNLNFPNERKVSSPLKMDATITAAHPVSISSRGNITLAAGSLDFDTTSEFKGIELADFTYLFPDTKVSVSSGQASVKAVSRCRQNYLDSNQRVEIRGMKLVGKGGFLGNAVLGLPSASVVKLLENKQGVLAVDFKVTGEINKLKTNLKEVVSAAFIRSFREKLVGYIMNMPRGIGQNVQNIGSNLGGGLRKTGTGVTNSFKKLFQIK
ncbi:MAG: AsmA family protein [Candidatus Ratteibacteria bacterium]|jgi:hypothetical protein